MKYLIFLTMTLLPAWATSQQYHPFPEQNAYWTVFEFNHYWDTYIYTVQGDTVINNKPYKKIWQLDDIPGSHDTLWVLHSFMRQDTIQKKVWFIRHYLNETTEKLGYDFDVQIGDTVYLPAFDYENSGDSVFTVIVPDNDSTLLWNGEYRKNYFFANLNHDIGLDPYVIEGVGTQRTPFPNLFYFDSFHQSELVCHKVNGVYLYGASPQPDECGFTVNIDEIISKHAITVKPNPCNNYVEIQFPGEHHIAKEILLINSLGKMILRNKIPPRLNMVRINTSSYQNGIYVVKITSGNGQFYTEKIIINH